MITIICGNPGAGKTCFLTYLAVNKILESRQDYSSAKKEILALQNGGFSRFELPPQKHLVYVDIQVQLNRRLRSYFVNGFEIGLDNPFFKTVVLPPYATVFLDEAQKYYDSRMSKFLRPEVYNFYQIHRQNHYNFYMVCQRLGNIDVNIRAIAERFIVIDKMTTEYDDYGFLKSITWETREFNSTECAEEYQLSKEKNLVASTGKKCKYITDLPIFNIYNSYGNKSLFYQNAQNKSFEYEEDTSFNSDLESMVEYNATHSFSAPKGFWKNKDEDPKILKKAGLTVYE